jgi:arylsulfatase A-like enzyme
VPWPEETEGIDPAKLGLPPYHVDNATTREWRAKYVAAIGKLDQELGLVYDTVREVLGEDAFFLHTSDHGAQWPFGKWTLYDDGIRSPLIVWGPGLMVPQSAGTTNDESVLCALDLNRSLFTLTKTPLPEGVSLDGGDPQLYDLASDPAESKNLAITQPEIAARLREAVFAWNATLPKDASDRTFKPGPMPEAPKGGKGKGKDKAK